MDSNLSIQIRLAVPEDAERMLAIYAPYVENTGVSFEDHPPESRSFRTRIEQMMEKLPWLVAEVDGKVVGYAYAAPHRVRAAYSWSTEFSVYIGSQYRHQGVGALLYQRLVTLVQRQGYRNVYALITLPNQAAVELHRKLGFTELEVRHHAGYKLGRWYDVLWMELDLFEGEESEDRIPLPLTLPKLIATGEIEELMNSGSTAEQ